MIISSLAVTKRAVAGMALKQGPVDGYATLLG